MFVWEKHVVQSFEEIQVSDNVSFQSFAAQASCLNVRLSVFPLAVPQRSSALLTIFLLQCLKESVYVNEKVGSKNNPCIN